MMSLPFTPESGAEAGSPLSIMRGRVAVVSNNVFALNNFVGAVKELRGSHTDKATNPSSRYFNSGYEQFMEHKARQSSIAAATQREVEVVKVTDIPRRTNTILDDKDGFDAHAFDLIAEAQRVADEAYDTAQAPKQAPDLDQTTMASPDEQGAELQATLQADPESIARTAHLTSLRDAANNFAIPKEQSNAYLAETAQRY